MQPAGHSFHGNLRERVFRGISAHYRTYKRNVSAICAIIGVLHHITRFNVRSPSPLLTRAPLPTSKKSTVPMPLLYVCISMYRVCIIYLLPCSHGIPRRMHSQFPKGRVVKEKMDPVTFSRATNHGESIFWKSQHSIGQSCCCS